MTVGLRSASGYFRRTSCVGMMLFLQYWYWYPLSYCLSLALQPSALIGLNADLKLPKMQVWLLATASSTLNWSSFPGGSAIACQHQGSGTTSCVSAVGHSRTSLSLAKLVSGRHQDAGQMSVWLLVAQVACKCKPSLFAYPKPVTAESSKVAVKVNKAVLSTTVRAKKREADKKAAEKAEDGNGNAAGPSGVLLGPQHHTMCPRGTRTLWRIFPGTALGHRDQLPENCLLVLLRAVSLEVFRQCRADSEA